MGTSYTETFDVRDGMPLLALHHDEDQTLSAALQGDNGHVIAQEIDDAITAQIRTDGVDTETGEWFGDWSARTIVAEVLATYGVTL